MVVVNDLRALVVRGLGPGTSLTVKRSGSMPGPTRLIPHAAFLDAANCELNDQTHTRAGGR